MTAPIARLMSAFETVSGSADLPDWADLAASLLVKEHPAKSYIFQQGDDGYSLYFVDRGLVKLCYESQSGAQVSKSILPETSIFASRNALDSGKADFSAVALETSVLVHIPIKKVSALIAKHHAWERLARSFFSALALKKERKEFQLLTMSAEERWHAIRQDYPDICKRVTQSELAALVGITPVALSRIKGRTRDRRLAQRDRFASQIQSG
jgi:CRP-like cAMP-binding protein